MLKIYQNKNYDENKVLRKISKPILIEKISSKKMQDNFDEMLDFVIEHPDGVALSAPQVGINLRYFIVSKNTFNFLKKDVLDEDLVFINPKIIKKSKKTEYMEEGCFSVRWYYGEVKRYTNVTIESYNRKGKRKIWNTGGFLAQIFQHEIDHLDGVLFTDKAINVRKASDEEIQKIKEAQKKLKLKLNKK